MLQRRLAPVPVLGMDATLAAAGRLAPGGLVPRRRGRGLPAQPSVLAGRPQGARPVRHRRGRVAGSARDRRGGSRRQRRGVRARAPSGSRRSAPRWPPSRSCARTRRHCAGTIEQALPPGRRHRRRDRPRGRADAAAARPVGPAGAPAACRTVDRAVDRSEPGRRARRRAAFVERRRACQARRFM